MAKAKAKKAPKPKGVKVSFTAAELRKWKAPKKVAAATPSTGMRTALVRAGMKKCVVSGTALEFCEAAHIFPDCWINDGTFKTRLTGYLPKNAITKKLLMSVANRILLSLNIHKYYDGLAQHGRGVGAWDFTATTAKGVYTVVVRGERGIKKELSALGVIDGKRIRLPHVDPRLVQWHNAQFGLFLPTAGAEGSQSEDDDEFGGGKVVDEAVEGVRMAMCNDLARSEMKRLRGVIAAY